MRKESTESRSESRPEWEQLEDWVRSQVQRLIQELLEEEVTAFLGRAKSALRSDSDSGLSERIRQSPEAYAEFGNDTAEAAASPRYRGAVLAKRSHLVGPRTGIGEHGGPVEVPAVRRRFPGVAVRHVRALQLIYSRILGLPLG